MIKENCSEASGAWRCAVCSCWEWRSTHSNRTDSSCSGGFDDDDDDDDDDEDDDGGDDNDETVKNDEYLIDDAYMDTKFDDFAKSHGQTHGQTDTAAYRDAMDASKNRHFIFRFLKNNYFRENQS